MKIFQMDVELQGSGDVTVNGRRLEEGDAMIDEKIIGKRLSTDQQWKLICVFKKNINKLYSLYRDARVAQGEVTEEDLRRTERKRARSPGPRPRLL